MKSVIVLCWAAAALWGVGLEPYGLECEARRNPVGIDAEHPQLGWKLKSDGLDQTQSSYHVLVASTREKLAAGIGDLWDSGRVRSDQQAWVVYAGKPLPSFQSAFWRVKVWDQSERPSNWSETAEWTVALRKAGEARGAWISHPDHSLRSGPLPLFRKELTLEKPLRQALVLIAGAGFHELHINGEKVGDHVLAPAWTNYRATLFYETFDVTQLLKAGQNALGVMLGNGFYNVAGGRYTKYTGSFGHPRLWLQVHLVFQDGTSADVSTDGTWKVTEGPITFSCIYGGEDYDAAREMNGWDRAGFDDSRWMKATTNEAPGGVLRAQASPPIRVQETFRPVKVTQPKPGMTVYDLGQNFSGWPRITVRGAAGTQIRMTPGELLSADGSVSQRSSGGPMYFSYRLRGSGQEVWEPRFSYYGFRYVQVEGGPLESLEGRFVHLDAPRVGQFQSSKELFNRIHRLIDAAIRSNLQHSLTDCPHREKLGWLEESHLMGPSLLYNFDLRTFLGKVVRDIREAQTVDGLIPDIAPEYVVFGRGFRDSAEWGSAGVLLPGMMWDWYGDKRALADSYNMMRSYVTYLGRQAQNGIISYGLGDWYDIGPKDPGTSQLTPLGLTATATYLEDLRIVSRSAKLLGLESEARTWETTRETTTRAFQDAFYQNGSYATGSQTSLAMPLALQIAPAAARETLADALVKDIRARNNHTSAGDIGYHYVVRALLNEGRSDVLFDLASQTSAPSYAAQLAAGATSLTEAWDANPNSSQNHLMLGHIEQWFYAGLAGIRPDPESPGLRRIRIQPEVVGDVQWVKASWETFRGPVRVDWKRERKAFALDVEIPPGMTADVRLPDGSSQAIGSGRRTLRCEIR